MKKLRVLAFIAMILGCIAFPVFFWESLIIWVTPVFPIAFSVYVCAGNNRRWVYADKIIRNPFLYLSIVVALFSTVSQFWQQISTSVWQFFDWSGSVWIAGVITVLVVGVFIFFGVRDYLERKADKKRRLAYEKRLAEKEIQEKVRKEDERKKKEKGQEMLQALTIKPSEPSWKDLIEIMETGVEIPHEMILGANLFSLIKVSNVKKKIAFNPDNIKKVSIALNWSVQQCYDDNHLQKAVNQFKKMETLSHYAGYESLVKIFKQYPLLDEICLQ